MMEMPFQYKFQTELEQKDFKAKETLIKNFKIKIFNIYFTI